MLVNRAWPTVVRVALHDTAAKCANKACLTTEIRLFRELIDAGSEADTHSNAQRPMSSLPRLAFPS